MALFFHDCTRYGQVRRLGNVSVTALSRHIFNFNSVVDEAGLTLVLCQIDSPQVRVCTQLIATQLRNSQPQRSSDPIHFNLAVLRQNTVWRPWHDGSVDAVTINTYPRYPITRNDRAQWDLYADRFLNHLINSKQTNHALHLWYLYQWLY